MSEYKAFKKRLFIRPEFASSWIAIGCLWLLTRLPYSLMMATGRHLGTLSYYLLGKRRRISLVNLKLAYPEKTSDEHRIVARHMFQHIGMATAETAWIWFRWPDAPMDIVIEGREHLEAAISRGKGVILLQAHFTVLELCGPVLGEIWPISAVYDPPKNALFDRLLLAQRSRHLQTLIDNKNIRDMIRRLKKGEIVWFSPDQSVSEQRGGIRVQFFDQAAMTSSGTARIAAMTKALIVPLIPSRLDNGQQYRLSFLAPVTLDTKDINLATQRVNDLLEQTIRRQPEQYLWAHKRFKAPDSNHADPYRNV